MAKEIPYFKFYTDDWLLGRIMELDYDIQGRFITFCAMYWRRKCDVSHDFFMKKTSKKARILLKNANLIEEKNGKISIKFLDEQYAQMLDSHNKRVRAGSKGGKAKALAMLEAMPEQCSSILEVDVDIDKKINKKRTLLEYVKLTDEEHEKLIQKLGDKQLDDYLERLNNYIGSKGKRYKSHYHTILSWHRRDNPPKQKSLQSKLYKPIKK